MGRVFHLVLGWGSSIELLDGELPFLPSSILLSPLFAFVSVPVNRKSLNPRRRQNRRIQPALDVDEFSGNNISSSSELCFLIFSAARQRHRHRHRHPLYPRSCLPNPCATRTTAPSTPTPAPLQPPRPNTFLMVGCNIIARLSRHRLAV